MSAFRGNFRSDFGTELAYTEPFMAEVSHQQLTAPAISATRNVNDFFEDDTYVLGIDEPALLDGLKELQVDEPTKIVLLPGWMNGHESTQLLEVTPTGGVFTTRKDKEGVSRGIFVADAPYAALISVGERAIEAKNEQQTNQVFWTGVLACKELVQGDGAEERLKQQVKEANERSRKRQVVLYPGIMAVTYGTFVAARHRLGIESISDLQAIGIAVFGGLMTSPLAVYLNNRAQESPRYSSTDILTKKHKKQARELAAEFPVIQIQES